MRKRAGLARYGLLKTELAGRQWKGIRDRADAAQEKYGLICLKEMSKLEVA